MPEFGLHTGSEQQATVVSRQASGFVSLLVSVRNMRELSD